MRTETRPKSLYEQAVAAENLRHASRLKELRAGEKKLALLNGITAELEAAGIVGPFEGSKAREVIVQDPQTLEQILKRLGEENL